MDKLTWVTLSVIFLQMSEVIGENVFVRNGSDAILPCTNMTDVQRKCDKSTWKKNTTVELNRELRSGRLTVTENCSLLIKNVTKDDVGQYTCRPVKTDQKYGTKVHLSVVTLTKHQDKNKITFNCSVHTYNKCLYKVKWRKVQNSLAIRRKDDICSTNVTFHCCEPEKLDSLTCEVTETDQKVHNFSFNSPDEKTGDKNNIQVKTTRATTTTKSTAAENSKESPNKFPFVAKVSIASALPAVIIITVVLLIWKINKGNKAEMGEDTIGDPEDAVAYASVHFTKKAIEAGGQSKNDDDDDGDAVTYSTVKFCSSSAAVIPASSMLR